VISAITPGGSMEKRKQIILRCSSEEKEHLKRIAKGFNITMLDLIKETSIGTLRDIGKAKRILQLLIPDPSKVKIERIKHEEENRTVHSMDDWIYSQGTDRDNDRD
jgi:hypothetical protein